MNEGCQHRGTATVEEVGTPTVESPGPSPAPSDPTSVPAKLNRRYITAALMMVMVLASMEQTVTSTAMPTIIGELHGLEHYAWVASIYLLACTVTMPLYGRLADALGRKRVILAAIGIFSVSSVLAASAQGIWELILYRGLQGLGAGGIMPVVLTILGDIFTLEERPRVQGFFSAVWGVASLAGPLLGYFLVQSLGWRSIFFVNLPFALGAMLVLAAKYHDHEKPHSTDLDLPGTFLLAACAASLVLISRLGPGGWPPIAGVPLLAAAGICGWLFLRHEKTAPNAIMPPALMLRRAVGPPMIGSCLLGIAFLSVDTYVPLYVQGGRGGGPGAAASVVTPIMLTWALSGMFAAPLILRAGFRRTALVGCVIVIAGLSGLWLCARFNAPQAVLTAMLAITGFGFGPMSMSYLLAAQDAVSWQQRGIITSGIQFTRTLGGAIGIGMLGMLFNFLISPEVERLRNLGVNPAALMDPHLHSQVPPGLLHEAQGMIARGLLPVFAVMLGSSVVCLIVTLFMSGHKAAHLVSRTEAIEAMV